MALVLGAAPMLAAQGRADSAGAAQHESPTQLWGSVGLGLGSASGGPLAGRAAASLAINSLFLVTVSATTVGGVERSANSNNILGGIKTSDSHRFLFLSAGLASATCGNSCNGHSGVAIDGGVHSGGKNVGVSLVGFVVRAPERNRASGVVLSFDFGLFGQ